MGKNHHHDPFEYFDFDLSRPCAGWQAGFADYLADQESLYELAWAYAIPPDIAIIATIILTNANLSRIAWRMTFPPR